MDRRTPVLIGVAQVEHRFDALQDALEPYDLMLNAIFEAADDCGNRDVITKVSSIRVSRGMWRYQDPGRYLAADIGKQGIESGKTIWGGNGVQAMLNRSAEDIMVNKHDVIVLTGGECGNAQAKFRKVGKRLEERALPGEPDWMLYPNEIPMGNRLEADRGLRTATQMYAIIETANRYARQETPKEHIDRVAKIWSRFNSVARSNPTAWIHASMSDVEIREASPNNRMVAYPYPKFMNANNRVDQGAALIVASTEIADQLQIPDEKRVYLWASAEANDTEYISNRASLCDAPGLHIAGKRTLELAEVGAEDLDHVDLYSCFPSAVQVAAKEIGLSEDRDLTVTGGLTFGGGPLNNYVMHSIAKMVELCRRNPTNVGLVTANGGYLTKHAMGVYSATPASFEFRSEISQSQVPTDRDRDVEDCPTGKLTIDGYTVTHNASGPIRGFASCLSNTGSRTWGWSEDPTIMEAMCNEEFCGRSATIKESGELYFL